MLSNTKHVSQEHPQNTPAGRRIIYSWVMTWLPLASWKFIFQTDVLQVNLVDKPNWQNIRIPRMNTVFGCIWFRNAWNLEFSNMPKWIEMASHGVQTGDASCFSQVKRSKSRERHQMGAKALADVGNLLGANVQSCVAVCWSESCVLILVDFYNTRHLKRVAVGGPQALFSKIGNRTLWVNVRHMIHMFQDASFFPTPKTSSWNVCGIILLNTPRLW